MRRFGGSLLLGLAAATFFLSPVVEQLLRLPPARSYFLKTMPDRADYSVVLGLILVVGLVVGLLSALASRFHFPVIRILLQAPIMILFAFGIEHVVHLHLSRYPPLWNSVAAAWNRVGVTATDGWFVVGLLLGLGVVTAIWRFPQTWASAKTMACGGAAALWFGCLINWWHPPLPFPPPAQRPAQTRQVREMGSGQPIVWIVLDEWDYDLTYQRSDGKVFPEFDRLRRQSVFLENVRAAGKATITAIPSLLMGRAVRDYRASNSAAARFATVSATPSEPFPGPRTIFDGAAQFGYRSQVVGWYHPYCRIFAGQVESCFWDGVMLPGMRHGLPALTRAAAYLRDSIEVEIVPFAGPSNMFVKHFERVNPMVDQAALFASKPGRMFSFLHLPVPHGPFFKLEPDGTMTALPSTVAGYQAGLDAADRALGTIRAAMERAGVWDEALVIVTSDHPYRYQFSGGYGNGHVPMMIKLPHQTAPAVYGNAFPAVDARGLIEDFMQGRLNTPERALAWLEHDAPAQGARATPVSPGMLHTP